MFGLPALLGVTTPLQDSAQPGTEPTSGPPSTLDTVEAGDGIANQMRLVIDRDGVLRVTERISFAGEVPEEFTRTFLVREPYDSELDQLYPIDGVRAEDHAGSRVDVQTDAGREVTRLVMDTSQVSSPTPGAVPTLVLRYEVRGATVHLGDRVELDWLAVGGYSRPVAETQIEVDAPLPPSALSCAAGDPRSTIYCTSSGMGGHEALIAQFTQAELAPGEILRINVNYPGESPAYGPITDRPFSLTSAFRITPLTGGVFAAILLVLVGGLVLLIRARGREERIQRAEMAAGDHAPVVCESSGMRFEPPDGVHPGQIGTLVDEQADVVDITATVVDLAVRGYMEIEELPASGRAGVERLAAVDWRLFRSATPPANDRLLPYEQLVLDALFQDGDTIRVSDLGEGFADRLAEARDELYRDMVHLGWFARRPNKVRNRWTTRGMVLTAAGMVLTVVLAIQTTLAFIGLAVIIAGAAVTVGANYMPAKTARGSTVLAHTLGFRRYLQRARASDIPEEERLSVFSHYLPYAIIFDNVNVWVRILATELRNEDLPWFHGPDTWHRDDVARSISTFVVTLSGVISSTRPFRTFI
ncbi:DUF2207 domain-containing protein [Lipingzhangella rawalii]|uniref:DUF2207 domain-containing protein n=1 Tax=Lipingzhangella rawalii TaxID=2055835 RepID=UPI00287BB88A|nr:DUF2207 domain-containing protein [Lipingzhangella rawalii]